MRSIDKSECVTIYYFCRSYFKILRQDLFQASEKTFSQTVAMLISFIKAADIDLKQKLQCLMTSLCLFVASGF